MNLTDTIVGEQVNLAEFMLIVKGSYGYRGICVKQEVGLILWIPAFAGMTWEAGMTWGGGNDMYNR